jgi:hypothetical protein
MVSVERMDDLVAHIAAKKARLDRIRLVSRAALLRRTPMTSNATGGSILTLHETAEFIEHGITVGGKPLRDHLAPAAGRDSGGT